MSFIGFLTNIYKKYTRRSNGTATVRYMFPAVLGTAAAFGLLALSGSSSGSYAFLETNTQTVESGEVFAVSVVAAAAVPVNAIQLEVNFPSDKLEVFSLDRGQSVITIWTEDPVIENTFVKLSGGTFRRGFIGEHELATINFRALETGQYNVSLGDVNFFAGDGEGTPIDIAQSPDTSLAFFTYDENTA